MMQKQKKMLLKWAVIYRILDRISYFIFAGKKKYFVGDEGDEFVRRWILSKNLFEKDHNKLEAFIKSAMSD